MGSIVGWRCYQPGDLNPQLSSFTSADLLQDPSLASYSGNPLSSIGEAINRAVRPDLTRGTKASMVKAVVLGGYMVEGQQALSFNVNVEAAAFGAAANRLQMLYVRIPEIHGMLSDPYCEDNSFTAEKTQALVEMHTTAAAPNWSSLPQNILPGTLVEVELTQGWNRGIVKKVLDPAASLQFAAGMSGMMAMNGFAGMFAAMNLPPMAPDEILECAKEYDAIRADIDLNGAMQHSRVDTPDTMAHPEFLPYLKCLFLRTYKEFQVHLHVNSVYRGYESQKRLYDAYNNCLAVGVAEHPEGGVSGRDCTIAGKPGPPKNNSHGAGMAIDLTPMKRDGTKFSNGSTSIKKGEVKHFWESSGAPAIAKSLGMKWGGDWAGTMYDPVHFYAGPTLLALSTKELRAKLTSMNMPNGPANTIPGMIKDNSGPSTS